MASNLVTKLGVDPSKYVSGMDQARKSLDSFQKQNLSNKAAMKEVTSVLTKYVSVAALVKGAQEVLTRTMQGSQTTADGWAATVDGCKNAVDTFFTALSKGDFSSFAQGLDVIISKGRAASVAMDQLGNTIMSFNYLSASNNAAFAQSLLTIRDTKATASERGAAVKAAEDELKFMTDIVAGKQATLYNAIAAVSTKKSPLAANQFVFEDIKACLSALFGVELTAVNKLSVRDYRRYLRAVFNISIKRFIPAVSLIGVDKVNILVLAEAFKQRTLSVILKLVPAHVGDDEPRVRDAVNIALYKPQALTLAELKAFVEKQLHTETDTHKGLL